VVRVGGGRFGPRPRAALHANVTHERAYALSTRSSSA
jgi:hypothetical protein